MITGASGFIGRHLTSELLKAGHQVHALLRPRNQLPNELLGVSVHAYDGTGKSIDLAFKSARPDVVVHLASLFLVEHQFSDIPNLCATNITFGTELVDAMIGNGCMHLVSAGTAWQNFGGQKGLPTNLYAATKEAFESILRYYCDARGLRNVTLKLFDTYGPRDSRKKLLRLLRDSAEAAQPLKLSPGEQEIDLLHVSDAVQAFMSAMVRVQKNPEGKFEDFYLRSGERNNLRTLVAKSAAASGKPIPVEWGSRPYRSREVMKPWAAGDILPGWSPKVPLDTGLKEFFAEDSNV